MNILCNKLSLNINFTQFYYCKSSLSSLLKIFNFRLSKHSNVFVSQYRYIRTKSFKETKKDNFKTNKNNENAEKDEFEKKFKSMEKEIKKRMEDYAKNQNVNPKLVNEYTKKIDVKKMTKTVLIIWTVIGFIISILFINFFTGGFSSNANFNFQFDGPHISFETFINNYLPSGEVQKIIHFMFQKKAVVILHDNAIIKGQQVKSNSAIIDLDRLSLVDPFKFREEIRKAEENLGIQMKNGIHIDEFREKSTLKLIELVIGLAILGWLCFQYGRLSRKSFDIWRKNKSKSDTSSDSKNN